MASQKALIPPLSLYRQILRAHRVHLPPQFRILGDGYVKAEFHRHKDVDNPLYIVGFLEQWQEYLNHILSASPKQQQSQQKEVTSSAAAASPSTSSISGSASVEAGSSDTAREATLQQLIAQGNAFGKKLDPALLDKMNAQQLGQLYELRKETRGLQSQQELDELAKEEAELFEKVAATLPASVLSSSTSS
ncbi:acetate non-utilizing protein 9 [Entomortierella chlamydospora]|uniref:Succinate dehydrogenase assembly factor 3 n=1 Tax=Entomortierella chlamydospora TaxID=101097 RepID=A0A9P6T1K2_9FUNG|nr:acetate non-utilizing protein 9 [Entomortierella chlamydospora]KAG0018457.1 acetate non-utilizing protein 9 [Entomortierella chlamydospora]